MTTLTNLAKNPSFETVTAGATTLRTNLITNPSAEVDAAGWGADASTVVRSTAQKYLGSASLLVTPSVNGGGTTQAMTGLTIGQTYTFSAWVYTTVAKNIRLFFTNPTVGSTTLLVPANTWTRLSVTYTAAATTSILYISSVDDTQPFYADAAMLEASPVLGDYFDGVAPARVRENLARNPRAVTGGAAAWKNNNWQVWDVDYVSTGVPPHPLGITTARRSNVKAGVTNLAALSFYDIDGLLNVNPARAIGVWVYSEQPGYEVKGIGGFPITPLVAGEWTFVKTTAAANTFSGVTVGKTTGVAVSTDFVYATGCIVELESEVGDYFDGVFSPTEGFAPVWSGAANASTSYLTDNDFTYAWTGTADASASVQQGVGVAEIVASSSAIGVQSSQWSSTGLKSLRVIPIGAAANSTWVRDIVATTPGVTYTVIGRIRLDAPQVSPDATVARRIRVLNAALSTLLGSTSQADNLAGETVVTGTFTATDATSNIIFYNGASAGNGDVWWDDFMLVEGEYTGPYFDGNTFGADWSGTPDASTSTKGLPALSFWDGTSEQWIAQDQLSVVA